MRELVPMTFSVAAAMLVAACTVQSLPGPKYVPEATASAGPEPRILKELVGCWRGTFSEYDSVTPISPALSTSSIKPVTTIYEFCFTMRPDGTGQLDMTDLEIGGHKATVKHFDNRVTSVDPQSSRASLHNHATVESAGYVLALFPVYVTEDIYADEEIQLVSPNQIFMKGKQLVVVGGNMFASMTFHTNLDRVQNAPAVSSSATLDGQPTGSLLASEFVVGTR